MLPEGFVAWSVTAQDNYEGLHSCWGAWSHFCLEMNEESPNHDLDFEL